MNEINKKQYIADVRVLNYLLQAIPNDIYNSVDACKTAKDMWERIKRFMYGSDVTNHVRHSWLMDEFDKFAAKERESLEYVYERLTTLVNIMDRNNVCPILVSINTKFLNCLQPEWSKYVTMSHASSSYLNSPQPYYVTHPSSVVDYEEDYQEELQGDSQEDNLTTAIMLLARAITQKFSTPTNNRLRTSSNTRNQAMIQDGRVDIQTKNAGYGGNGNRNAGRQNRNQGFNAGNGLTQNDESNQIVQCVPRIESNPGKANMARIQLADDNAVTEPNYYAKAVSEVNASHKMIPKEVYEHKNHEKCKTIFNTSDDDQIDSNIIFDDPYVENNGGSNEHESNAHDQYHDVKIMAFNVQREAKNKK
ncbi:hypothetical protein Tco_1326263 [Tanacetum coccineum]